jgi:predicted HicB family RNase H-like nuclease
MARNGSQDPNGPATTDEEKQVLIRLSPQLHLLVQMCAASKGLSVRKYVESAVHESVQHDKSAAKQLLEQL